METFQSLSKGIRFQDMCRAVGHCTLCPRLSGRRPILSNANGNVLTKVLFIAEAPGRLGADITGIPLFGDQTGENFEAFLNEIGWCRDDIFITNAILCNPRDANGNNSTPTSEEIANCAPYLDMTVQLIEPEVVVTLGSVALEALKNIRTHSYALREHMGRLLPWNGRALMPMYHPGPRARVHRSTREQLSDFMRLAQLVDPQKGIKEGQYKKLHCGRDKSGSFHRFQKLAYTIIEFVGSMTYFKLTKLLYLVDLEALGRLGRTVTGEVYLREKEGPWPPKLQRMIEPLEGREIEFFYKGRMPMVEPGPSPRIEIDFRNAELEIIEDVLRRYGRLDNTGMKIAVYRTRPMRYVREQEKLGRSMINLPVIYKDKAVPELVV